MDDILYSIKRMKEMSMIFDDVKDTYNDETLYDIDTFDDENHINKLIQEQNSLYDKKSIHKDFITYLPSFTIRDVVYSRNYHVYKLAKFFNYYDDNNINYERVKNILLNYKNFDTIYKEAAIRTLNINITETFDINIDIKILVEQLITTFKSALTLNVTSDYLRWTNYYIQNVVVIHFINYRFKNNKEYFNRIYDIIKIVNARIALEYEDNISFSYMIDINKETNEIEGVYVVCYLCNTNDTPIFVSRDRIYGTEDIYLKNNLYDIDKGFIDNNFKI